MESLLSLQELLSAVNGTLLGKNESIIFTNVQTDSRIVEERSLFVPLIGEFQNGHKYIPQAIEKGASVIFINKAEYANNENFYDKIVVENSSVAFVTVENTLTALQNAAEAYVTKTCQNMIKICITGSSGKTTTKELMVSVAMAAFGENNVAYTKGNFNSETGLPLSVFKIRGDEKIGIFEMGMNREHEIEEISKVFKAKYGIITNIGTAHIGLLGSRENIAKEKRKAFDYIPADGAAFVPALDDFADYCTEKVKGKIVKYGKSVSEEESGVKFVKDDGLFGTTFTLDGQEIHLSLTGEYNYSNALGVVACAKAIGIPVEKIKAGIEKMKSVNGRMEICKAKLPAGKNVILLKDFYNANPDSMGKAVDFCAGLKDVPSKIYVLADMKELGKDSKAAHKSIGEKIANTIANESAKVSAVLIGKEIKPAMKILKKANLSNMVWNKNNDKESFLAVVEKLNSISEENSVILFKGSHSMNLETLCKMLQGEQNG